MMDQWFDSLSEDWVSQPRSQHSSSVLRDSPAANPNGSQSRIPRYKPRSVSNLSITGAAPERSSAPQPVKSQEAILKERTPSSVNAERKRLSNGQAKPKSSSSTSKKGPEAQRSPSSTLPSQVGTVQHKSSPEKKENIQGTPEWKRRMLKGKVRAGDQTDLFSPKAGGLEGMFKPPTIGAKLKPKAGGKRQTTPTNDFPSSPPPYPSLARKFSSPTKSDPLENSNRDSSKEKGLDWRSPRSQSDGSDVLARHGLGRGGSINSNRSVLYAKSGNKPTRPNLDRASSSILPAAHKHEAGSSQEQPFAPLDGEDSKSFSGLDQSGNENISPFYVSKHNTVDGRVDYAAIDMSMRRLHSGMDKLRLQQENIPSSRSSDHGVDYSDSRQNDQSLLQEGLHEITSQSLPEDLSTGTDAFVANGGFVSIRRGGYSNEGSFQRRTLSPSSSVDVDGPSMGRQSSINTVQLNKVSIVSQSKKSEGAQSSPRTPKQPNADIASSPERPRSSGSPLKLFDNYDTFTNDRLARRMSKFEETLQKGLEEDVSCEGLHVRSSPSPGPKTLQRGVPRDSRRVSTFGEGELDARMFNQDFEQDPCFPQLPHLFQDQFMSGRPIRHRSSGKRSANIPRTRDGSRKINDESKVDGEPNKANKDPGSHNAYTADVDERDVPRTDHGKRLPHSPAKDPAPKRRRTLRSSEERRESTSRLDRKDFEFPETPAKSLLGRKRKDALYDNEMQAADPNLIAQRQIRRPRGPASIQAETSRGLVSAQKINSPRTLGKRNMAKGDTGERIFPHKLDPPTEIVAGALATVALNTVQDIAHGSRKASVTTADFFSEAQQIMQLIRAEKRPISSHALAEESEVEHATIVEQSGFAESTKDHLSRPPSREGGSLRKLRPQSQMDARVVSHLRKFEDEDDLGLALSSSFKSIKMGRSRSGSEASVAGSGGESGGECDPPNIRILERNIHEDLQEHGHSLLDDLQYVANARTQYVTSQGSPGLSTKRSIPTGSSGSSGNKKIIAPETVAHLLSDQMAGMIFDRQKQMWVRRKGSVNTLGADSDAQIESEETEEDLFRDIPDLTVNEMEELKRVKEAVSSGQAFEPVASNTSRHDHATVTVLALQASTVKDKVTVPAAQTSRVQDAGRNSDEIRPKTAEGKSTNPVEDSSAPSKYSHFAASGPAPSTRATSWGDEVWPHKETQTKPPLPVSIASATQGHAEEVEHEISILEGRVSEDPGRKHRQARVVTVAFSSPLVDQMHNPGLYNDGWEEASQLGFDESPSRSLSQRTTSIRRLKSSGAARRSNQRSTSRRMSFGNQSYTARPMSRLDEQNEMSLVQYSVNGNRSMVAISTPMPSNRSMLVPATGGQRSMIDFHLSPLSDFTLHQVDRPLDTEHDTVTKGQDPKSLKEVRNKLSLTGQDLVKHLTDLEPYEPYWDYIRSVDLRGRSLTSLHMLDEFCSRAEDLDVSENNVEDLNGVPPTVRMLNIRKNNLSDLTAWHQLQHLQYLDVSYNRLRSLQGFQGLVHLRGLRADNNEIEDLGGIEDMNGLLSLKLTGNRLRAIDFDQFDL